MSMLSVTQAWDLIDSSVKPRSPLRMQLAKTLGTWLAEDVISQEDSPPFDKSMMDGFAVRFEDLQGDRVSLSIIDDLFAGQTPRLPVAANTAVRIMTGAPLPTGATAVIPIEWTTENESRGVTIALRQPVRHGMNILRQGTSLRREELVLQSGTRIRPPELALLAELGLASPLVFPRPVVGILATGDELVDVGHPLNAGQIRNSNSLMLATQVEQAGAVPRLLGIARDNVDDLRTRVRQGLECDVLCLSGGVSAGAADLVPGVLQAAGVSQIFHKVAVKPGKPVWFGCGSRDAGTGREEPVYVFGLPGNPVSSMVCFELFVRSALRRLTGMPSGRPVLRRARIADRFSYRGDRQTWFPGKLSLCGPELWVQPANWKGSADLRGTVGANCSLVVPPGAGEWAKGTEVNVLPWGSGLDGIAFD